MQRLNGLDAQFIYSEASGWPMHMASLAIFDAANAPFGLDAERIRELCRQRLPHLGLFRNKLVRVPGGLDRPVWIEDGDVDMEALIHEIHLPAPGTDRQLAELAAELYAPRMDVDRSVWEKWVITGLEGGRVAVLDLLHHCALDGVRGVEVQEASYDLTADAPFSRPGGAPLVTEEAPGRGRLLADAAVRLAGTPVRLVKTGAAAAVAGRRLIGAVRDGRESHLALPFTAPRTSFNRPVTERRALAFGSLPLTDIKRVARAEGVTVNDVVLAIVGGGLRRYLADHDDLPERPLLATIPVGFASVPGEPPASGNKFSAMVASLATDVADPIERLHRISASASSGKSLTQSLGADLILDLVELLPPATIGLVARGYTALRLSAHHPPLANVVVSDVRGAPMPLYLAGARMLASYPFGPASDIGSVNVTLISYQDSLDVGLTTCPDVLEDPWELLEALQAEAADLAARYPAKVPSPRRRRAATHPA